MVVRGKDSPSPTDDDPIYAPGLWYAMSPTLDIAGAVVSANLIALMPFQIRRRVTIQALACRVTTLAAGGNVQLAVYAANLNTSLPIGQPVAKTGNIVTDATGYLSLPVLDKAGAALAPYGATLDRGLYWFGVNADASAAGTAILHALNAGSQYVGNLVGAVTLANAGGGYFKSAAATFGTWPDLTGVALTETPAQNFATGWFQVNPTG